MWVRIEMNSHHTHTHTKVYCLACNWLNVPFRSKNSTHLLRSRLRRCLCISIFVQCNQNDKDGVLSRYFIMIYLLESRYLCVYFFCVRWDALFWCFVCVRNNDREREREAEVQSNGSKRNGTIKHLVAFLFLIVLLVLLKPVSIVFVIRWRFSSTKFPLQIVWYGCFVAEIEWNHPLNGVSVFFPFCTVLDKCCQNRVIITTNFGAATVYTQAKLCVRYREWWR